MTSDLTVSHLLGPNGPGIAAAMRAAQCFVDGHDTGELLAQVGQSVDSVPPFEPVDKAALPASYGGAQEGPSDDFLAGRGLFYVTEQRRLFLDCTAGHYQMLWGYNHPDLCRGIEEAGRAGIVWDNHTNIPQAPLKRLARRLLDAANAPGDPDPLDKALLGVCTGSVACAAALKIMLRVYETDRSRVGAPVIVVLDGNYHGTDMVAQYLRGMWPQYVHGLEVVAVQPNDIFELNTAFERNRGRVAGFWAEPVMMNREAIAIHPAYFRVARALCDAVGALLCIDEIQTGFWQPELFAFRTLDVRPDLVVTGKGMTAGFHPLAGVLYRSRNDVLAQYDAISTNGSAALPAFAALCSMELIADQAERIRAAAQRIQQGFAGLVREFPDRLEAANGRGHLAGLKFGTVEAAKACHARLLERGLWTRVHAYHEGHRTVLTKLGLLADDAVIDFMLENLRAAVRGV